MTIRQGDKLIAGQTLTTDYNSLGNKPSINNIVLEGNKTLEDLGIASITNEFVTKTELTATLTDYVNNEALTERFAEELTAVVSKEELPTELEPYAKIENTYTKEEVDTKIEAKDSLPPQSEETYGKFLQSNQSEAAWVSLGIIRDWNE